MSSNFGGLILILIGFVLTLQVRDSASLSVEETHKEAIDTLTKALTLYDTLKLWDTFDETVVKLNEYRGEFSTERQYLIADIRTYMVNSKDAFWSSTQSIYEWCGLTTSLLSAYNKVSTNLDQTKFSAQRSLLLKVLDNGLKQMNEALEKLGVTSKNFNEATTRLVSLVPYLQDRTELIRTFFKETTERVNKQITLIEEISGKLKDELRLIQDLRAQIEVLGTFEGTTELQEDVFESANNLIKKCREYRQQRFE